MIYGHPGTQLVTSDAVVGVSGKPTRVFSIDVVGGSGGVASPVLRNGSTTGGTIYVQADTSAASKGLHIDWPQGILFPAGCFCDVDANTTSVAVTFVTEL